MIIGCFAFSTFIFLGRLLQDDLAASVARAKAWLHSAIHSNSTSFPTHHKYAFATFLGPNRLSHEEQAKAGHEDPYFIGARILTYQLRHAPDTKSEIPFIVLVTHDVDEEKKRRLKLDGAIVHEVDRVDPGNAVTSQERWVDMMNKLRLWQMTEYERIVYLDADVVLFKPIDGLFDDPAAELQDTLPEGDDWDAGLLPTHYVLAGSAGTVPDHAWPPEYPFAWYMNAGLFILKPDLQLFEYYMGLTKLEELPFDPLFSEQSLLYYAHRWDGPMPWKQIGWEWVTHKTTVEDVEGGVHMAHEHFWDPLNEDMRPFLEGKRDEMEEFWEGREV